MHVLGKVSPESEEILPPFVNKKGAVCNSHSTYREYIYKHVLKLQWEIRLQKVCKGCTNGYDLPRPQFTYVIQQLIHNPSSATAEHPTLDVIHMK